MSDPYEDMLKELDLNQNKDLPSIKETEYSPIHSVKEPENKDSFEEDEYDFDIDSPDVTPDEILGNKPPSDDGEYKTFTPSSGEDRDEDSGKKKFTTFAGVIVVVVLVFVFVGIFIFNMSNKAKTASKDVSSGNIQSKLESTVEDFRDNGEVVAALESIKIASKTYVDTMAIKKFLVIKDGSFICYFEGIPKVYGKRVKFSVSTDIYNKYVDGTSLKLKFKATKINKVDYITDIVVE